MRAELPHVDYAVHQQLLEDHEKLKAENAALKAQVEKLKAKKPEVIVDIDPKPAKKKAPPKAKASKRKSRR